MYLLPTRIRVSVIINVTFLNWYKLRLRGIVLLFLHMGRPDQEKHTQWLENKRFLQDKCTNKMKERELFLEQFNSYGRESDKVSKIIQSKPVSHKFTISRLRICSILSLEFCIVVGILPMDFLLRILSWLTVWLLMTWFQSCCKEWRTEKVDLTRWTKIHLEVIQSWPSISSVSRNKGHRI